MLSKPPQAITWALWGAGAVLFYVLFHLADGYLEQTAAGLPLFLCGCVMFGTFLDWAGYTWATRLEAFNRARAVTPEAAILDRERAIYEVLARMTPEQIRVLEHNTMVFRYLPGMPHALREVKVAGMSVSWEWIRDWIEAGEYPFLQPIRAYPEGTRDRELAEWITDYVIKLGWAAQHNGNRPAHWTVPMEQVRAYLLREGVDE